MQLLVRKEHYLPANSLREASSSAAQIIGMGLAAVILGLWGIGMAIMIDALTFLFSGITAMAARIDGDLTAEKEAISPRVMLNELKEGTSLIRNNTVLAVTVVLACLANLLLTPYNLLIPAYSDKILLAGAKGYSFIEMAFTIGIIIGALLLGQIGGRFRKSVLILAGFAVFGLGIASLGFIDSLYIAVLVCGLNGIFLSFINTSAITIVQEITPKDKMGRVSSILSTLAMLGMPLGYAISGFIASGLEIQTTFLVLGLLIFIMVIPVLFIKEFANY
jgi:DHA3 family macrolide efflux protein-like MFS transporter